MATIRGGLRFSKDISIIMLLGVVYVLGLSVATLIGASKNRMPQLHAAGGKIRSRLRRPV
ncbi:hypothetical protein Harman_00590 [Haloarcula mannanilytica]|uniref:Uncharacterized protein n=1 Tax=Haloarcula mannanilytica TaxID=2509225 RepID=A0A4C2ECY4_9EURY|nr:hypothetical protein [Haloarcula mannanilytica]GCF12124.1 hypothetical protein Harman_00590 [Haloarcula mannanilytica]